MKPQIIEQQQLSEQDEVQNVNHNYSTRRNRGANNDDSQKDIYDQQPLVSEKILPTNGNLISKNQKNKGGKKKDTEPPLTYEQLGLLPITEFDFKNYNEDWCRYCGSRYSSNFTQGPWGSKTLCTVHYIKWKQDKTLKLDAYPVRPETPIDPINDQERKYITSVVNKHPDWSYADVIQSLEIKKNPKRLQSSMI